MQFLQRLRIGPRLALAFLVPVALLGVNGLVGLQGLLAVHDGSAALYQDRVVPLRQLKVIADAYAVNVVDAVNKAQAGLMTAEEALKAVQAARTDIRKEWADYMATTLTAEEERLAREAVKLFEPANLDISKLEEALKSMSGSVAGQLSAFNGPLYSTVDPISGKISELIELQLRVASEVHQASEQAFLVGRRGTHLGRRRRGRGRRRCRYGHRRGAGLPAAGLLHLPFHHAAHDEGGAGRAGHCRRRPQHAVSGDRA